LRGRLRERSLVSTGPGVRIVLVQHVTTRPSSRHFIPRDIPRKRKPGAAMRNSRASRPVTVSTSDGCRRYRAADDGCPLQRRRHLPWSLDWPRRVPQCHHRRRLRTVAPVLVDGAGRCPAARYREHALMIMDVAMPRARTSATLSGNRLRSGNSIPEPLYPKAKALGEFAQTPQILICVVSVASTSEPRVAVQSAEVVLGDVGGRAVTPDSHVGTCRDTVHPTITRNVDETHVGHVA
jgi:hypothetical protein